MKKHLFWGAIMVVVLYGTYFLSLPPKKHEEQSINIKKVAQTDKFYTIRKDEYIYDGGAHGYTITRWNSFDKKTKVQINDKILNDRKDERLNDLLRQGLIAYFAKYVPLYGGREFEPNKLHEEILVDVEEGNLPPPKGEPFLMEKGVGFMYGQYEISNYANGQPAFVVPYYLMQHYMSAEILALVEPIKYDTEIEPILP